MTRTKTKFRVSTTSAEIGLFSIPRIAAEYAKIWKDELSATHRQFMKLELIQLLEAIERRALERK